MKINNNQVWNKLHSSGSQSGSSSVTKESIKKIKKSPFKKVKPSPKVLNNIILIFNTKFTHKKKIFFIQKKLKKKKIKLFFQKIGKINLKKKLNWFFL